MTTTPVSQALRDELTAEIRRHGIVVWLDKDASYTAFVDQLVDAGPNGAFPYPIVAFRGSFLETIFALESFGSHTDRHGLLIHMPGFVEESIRKTPILELYAAGARYRKALETLIRQAATGRIAPAEVDAFVARKPTLAEADVWVAEAVGRQGVGLEALLDSTGPSMLVDALVRSDSALAVHVRDEGSAAALQTYLHKLSGMDGAWSSFVVGAQRLSPLEKVLTAFGAWVLCVEYVHDLRRAPHLGALKPLRELAQPLVKVCRDLVAEVRRRDGDAYARLADETEALLDDELRAMTPEDLGQIDTFREEENRVLEGAVEALGRGEWKKAGDWARHREGDRSFWLQRDPVRRRAWGLVAEAARFGEAIAESPQPFAKVRDHEEALKAYADKGAPVDRAHRRFEQERLRRLDPQLPHFGALQEVVGKLRRLHREWADRLARDFSRLCHDRGFLPTADLQQRSIYDDVVQPLTFGGERVAVFVIDAFRYEMATELLEELRAAGGGAIVDLKARFAELPTLTSVGMNVLAPVAQNGRLVVAGTFQGFKTGEYTVRSPEDRARAMGTRTAGKPALRLSLSDACDLPSATLTKKIKDHRVVVVHSTEIDDAGEANVGLLTFESIIRQIRAAWHHLQLAGIKQAVFTADHGFLLQDETSTVRTYGNRRTPSRRHVLDAHARGEDGMMPVALSSLGYEGIEGYLLLREDTAVFDTGTTGATFVHGGNSPQERIIPVLTVSRRHAQAASLSPYAIEAQPLSDAFGLHRIQVRVGFPPGANASLGFVAARAIDLDLQAPGHPHVEVIVKEVTGAGRLKPGRIQVPVGEAWTEIFFALEGPADERIKIEVHHPDKIEQVAPASPDALFLVRGTGTKKPASTPPRRAGSWAEAFEDEAIRKVFVHLETHGSITESEIVTSLGSARAARRFALQFDTYVAKLPFKVRSEANDSGKRYVREEDR